MLKNTGAYYGSLSKFFHWIIAFLILCMLPLGYLMSGHTLMTVHKLTGLFILTLAALRLIWILLNPHPRLPATVSRLEKIAARAVEGLLYLCMFGMPLSGWAMSTAFGYFPMIGGVALPMPFVPVDHDFAMTFENIHGTLALILIGLISLHILGALKHYFFDKDQVVQNMLPSCCAKKNNAGVREQA